MNVKRLIDLLFVIVAGILLAPLMVLIALLIKLNSSGPILHWSKRVGKYNTFFMMPKFRSMRLGTPDVATHLLSDPQQHLTMIGKILRKASLDELPQLYSIFKGDMSLVGPRPALHNQDDLISMRTEKGIHKLPVGLTGWAQINGRDSISLERKVELEVVYLRKQSIRFDLFIIWQTFIKMIKKVGPEVAH